MRVESAPRLVLFPRCARPLSPTFRQQLHQRRSGGIECNDWTTRLRVLLTGHDNWRCATAALEDVTTAASTSSTVDGVMIRRSNASHEMIRNDNIGCIHASMLLHRMILFSADWLELFRSDLVLLLLFLVWRIHSYSKRLKSWHRRTSNLEPYLLISTD
jgi:hypothetical protein